jgi:GAF domain-containing protein
MTESESFYPRSPACSLVDKGEGMNNNHASKRGREFLFHFSPGGEELLSSCFAVMIHCLKARRCYVMLLDKECSELAVVKASGPKGAFSLGDRIAFGQSIAGWVAEYKQPLVSANHIMKGPGAAIWKGAFANGPFLAVPILGEDDLHGVLMACNKLNGGTFSEHDLVTAEMLANHLALCIEEGFLFGEGVEKRSVAPPPPTEKPM